MHKIKEQLKLYYDEMRTILDGTMSRDIPILGLLEHNNPREKEVSQQGRSFLIGEGDFFSVLFVMKTTL